MEAHTMSKQRAQSLSVSAPPHRHTDIHFPGMVGNKILVPFAVVVVCFFFPFTPSGGKKRDKRKPTWPAAASAAAVSTVASCCITVLQWLMVVCLQNGCHPARSRVLLFSVFIKTQYGERINASCRRPGRYNNVAALGHADECGYERSAQGAST